MREALWKWCDLMAGEGRESSEVKSDGGVWPSASFGNNALNSTYRTNIDCFIFIENIIYKQKGGSGNKVQKGPSKYGPLFSDWLQVRMRVTFTDTIWNETQITESKRIEFLKRGCL